MAYFSNGCEGEALDEDCANCIYGKDPCPIAWAQLNWNYEACNNPVASAILNSLIRQDTEKPWAYKGCAMKELIDKKEKRNG